MRNKKSGKSIIYQLNDYDFINLVNRSNTVAEIVRYFNLNPAGSNYNTIKQRMNYLNLDYNQFISDSKKFMSNQLREKPLYSITPLEDILVQNSTYSTNNLKHRLFKLNVLKEECNKCGVGNIWQEERLALELDHINGINNDHRLENLRILCPNCHSQTETFGGKNLKKFYQCECGNLINKNSQACRRCSRKSYYERNSKIPSKEILEKEVWEIPSSKLKEKYGVSDTAIVKWCKKLGIKKPGREYWAKKKSIDNYIEKSILEELIWKIPLGQISNQLLVSIAIIKKSCKYYGLDRPPAQYWNDKKLKV